MKALLGKLRKFQGQGKKLGKFLKLSAIMLFITIVALLCLAVWFYGPSWSFLPLESTTNRLIAIGIIVLIALPIFFLIRRRQKASAAAAAAAEAEAADGAPAAPSDEQLLTEFKVGYEPVFKALKKLRTIGNKRKTYHQAPWFLVIGEQGSGKTGLIRNSGHHIPLPDKVSWLMPSNSDKNSQCDWSLTSDAVFIDLPRYEQSNTEDGYIIKPTNKIGWTGTLELLKKNRGKKPVDGVVVTLSIANLLLQNKQGVTNLGRYIKQSLQDIQQQLGENTPVYLSLTKCDLIAGFNESFANLKNQELEKIWGMTFPLIREERSIKGSLFDHEYENLLSRIGERSLWQLDQQTDTQKKELISMFPLQMRMFKKPLAIFIHEAFGAHHYCDYQETKLRGLYFTSNIQKGAPYNFALSAIANNLSIAQPIRTNQPHQEISYFTNCFISDVLLYEASILNAKLSESTTKQTVRQVLVYTTVTAGVVGGLGLANTFIQNQANTKQVRQYLSQYQEQANLINFDYARPAELINLLNSLQNMQRYLFTYQSGWIFKDLSNHRSLVTTGQEISRSALNDIFLPSVMREVESLLNKYANDPVQLNRALRAYRALGSNSGDRLAAITQVLEREWSEQLSNQPARISQLLGHLKVALRMMQEPLPVKRNLITITEEKLQAPTPIFGAYARHIEQVFSASPNAIDVQQTLGNDFNAIFTYGSKFKAIPSLYSANGFRTLYPSRRNNFVQNVIHSTRSQYTLDNNMNQRMRDSLSFQLDSIYAERYANYWRDFIDSIEITQWHSLNEAVDALESLTGYHSPLTRLLDMIRGNTYINLRGDNIDIKTEFLELNRLTLTTTQGRSLLDDAIISLDALELHLSSVVNSTDPNAILKATTQRMMGNGASNDPIEIVQAIAEQLPAPLNQLLYDITDQIWQLMLEEAREAINQLWQEQIHNKFQNLASSYPFTATSKKDINERDFISFFGVGGELSTFFDAYLRPFIDTSRRPWRWYALDDRNLGMSQTTLTQLERANHITEVFFANNANPNSRQKFNTLQFVLKPVHLDRDASLIELSMGRQTITYDHGPTREQLLTWPANGVNNDITISFTGFTNSTQRLQLTGLWAWFRLLDSKNLKPMTTPGRYLLTIENRGNKAIFELYAEDDSNLSFMTNLKTLQLPVRL